MKNKHAGSLKTAAGGAKAEPSSAGYPETPCHDAILAGLPIQAVSEAAGQYGISPAAMAERIGLPRSTFHRKQKEDAPLSGHESDALARHTALLERAISVFDGDKEAARQWLGCPQIGLGGAVPLDCAQTTFGFREVEKLLVRVDRGAYA